MRLIFSSWTFPTWYTLCFCSVSTKIIFLLYYIYIQFDCILILLLNYQFKFYNFITVIASFLLNYFYF